MDTACGAKEIRACSELLGPVPIIDPNPHAGRQVPGVGIRARRVASRLPAGRLRERTSVERVDGCLKAGFSGRRIHARGPVKVMARPMFGVCALSVDQLIRQPH